MTKDVNIHIKTRGADKSRRDLDKVGNSAKGVGDKTRKGSKQAGDAVEQSTGKLKGLGGVLGTLKSQVMGFVGAWLGFSGVQRILDYVIRRLETIKRLQAEIHDRTVEASQIGQALEFQTGTLGRQQFWSRQALALQQAGGLESPQTAQQMLVSMDIAFADQGGIKNRAVRDIAGKLAPFVGAAQLGPAEVAKLFEFAGTAGVAPTATAYEDYFAKLTAGYTSAKATDFGRFMVGLQKGGTAYMSAGGTLEQAISAFGSARSVMPNEELAATLIEQVARLSSGAYAKPRAAMERALGVDWGSLNMDQRMESLLKYVRQIPESQRGSLLAEQGFPVELTTQIGKMVSPEASRAMTATRQAVESAAGASVRAASQAYTDSVLGRQRQTAARAAATRTAAGPDFADWQNRIKQARAEFEVLQAKGEDTDVWDKHEPYVMAFDQLYRDVVAFKKSLPDDDPRRAEADNLRGAILAALARRRETVAGLLTPAAGGAATGYKLTRRFAELQQQPANQPAPVTINNVQNHIFQPTVGTDPVDLGIGDRAFSD